MSDTKLRTPDAIYFEHGVIQFNQKDREIYYEVWVWSKDGLNKSRLSNKQKLIEGELKVLGTFTKTEQVHQHLNTKVSN